MSGMDFRAIAERWRGLPRRDRTRPPLPSLELDRFLKALTASGARGWFAACQGWVARRGPSPDEHPEIQEILDLFSRSRDPFRHAVARAHLDVARLLLDSRQPSPADLRAVAEQAGVRAGLLRDLCQELLPADQGGGGPRPKAGTQALTALLVDGAEDRGVAAWLDLDLIADGAGEFYPHPGLAFVARDERWVRAEEAACDYVKKAGLWAGQDRLDIRWSLLGRDEIPSALNGDSIGAAFALGMVRLLAETKEEGLNASFRGFKGVDVASVAVSAGVRVDRRQCRLRAVDHIPEKLEAVSRARTVCNLRFVLLPEENRPEVEKGFYRGLLSDDPLMELRVVCADTLSKAAESLAGWQRVNEAVQRGLARGRGPESSASAPALLVPQEPALSPEKLYLKWLVGETGALSQPWPEAPILPTPARMYRSPGEQGRALLYRRFPPDASQDPALKSSGRSAQGVSGAPVEIEDLAKALRKFQKVVVLGGPGSGKSVCLRQFTCDLARRELRRRGRPRTLPILAGMGAYNGQEDGGPLPVLKFLRQWLLSSEQVRQGGTAHPLCHVARNLEALLKEGRVTCVFDTLDEMPRQGYAKRFQSLQAFMRAWTPHGNRFVCACRLQDYGPGLDADAVVIAPFDRARIASFLRKSAPGVAGALIRRVAGDASLEALLSNPFFLQALACVNRPFSDAQTRAVGPYVPETREGLFRAFVEAVLKGEGLSGQAGAPGDIRQRYPEWEK